VKELRREFWIIHEPVLRAIGQIAQKHGKEQHTFEIPPCQHNDSPLSALAQYLVNYAAHLHCFLLALRSNKREKQR
jgi:hypothetical protein